MAPPLAPVKVRTSRQNRIMTDNEAESSNNPHFSVSELSQALKRTLEDRFNYVRVRGEISNYRGPHASGNAYFSLKDEAARIEIVIWRNVFSRIRVKPADGLEVIACGKITTYSGKSSYQLIVESLEPAGPGALMALLDARQRQLAAEGLFNLDRKRQLPFLPRVVGVVTSPSGSVIWDILHRLADRFPVHVVLWPVRVQGAGSAEEIVAAIVGISNFSQQSLIPRPDVLIVARGGGSLEDLLSFNDEAVVRAAADCPIPLISAVGHETDWTLIDHVADVRAPTPTAAAEMCVPVRSELVARVAQLEARRSGAFGRLTRQRQAALISMSRGIPSIRSLPLHLTQRIDSLFDSLQAATRSKSGVQALSVARVAGRLSRHSPFVRLAIAGERAATIDRRLAAIGNRAFETVRQQLRRNATSLSGLVDASLERRGAQMASVVRSWASRRLGEMRSLSQSHEHTKQRAISLRRAIGECFQQRNESAIFVAHVFGAINYKSALARGFAIVVDRNNRVITRSEHARKVGTFTIRFSDGKIAASTGSRPASRRAPKGRRETTQNELF